VTHMSRLRLGAECEGVLAFVAEDDLILTSATAAPPFFAASGFIVSPESSDPAPSVRQAPWVSP
jgi:hypothetical protein